MNDVNFASYTNDNTIYDSAESNYDIIMSSQESVKRIFQWISDKQMIGNIDNIIWLWALTNSCKSYLEILQLSVL